ncbi:MAG: ATP-dependent Clp protease ATP-binding subunit, partial [Hydrococcus sp. RM1_1_31]|nr:ATP-dependent Clp protease ATP-binding subunit [Hydrococcus sp. RM1_1_31]
MAWRILSWLLVGCIVIWILGIVLAVLPFFLGLLFKVILALSAICSFYALLPENLRIPKVERWFNPDWQKNRVPNLEPQPVLVGTSVTTAPDTKDDSTPESSGKSNSKLPPPPKIPKFTEPEIPKPLQPELNFDTIVPRIGGKLPEREELKSKLLAKVIGQEAAIDTLIRVVFGKLAAHKSPKPLVVFLPGPTGTGKTEISKALADALECKLTRFDMGEYAESHKASNLFGSPKGYVGSTEGGALPNALRHSKRRCILLFDEVEKAHLSLWRQLLAFFDEGRVSDTLGNVVAPKDTICLLTSNLEADKIGENPEAAKSILKQCGYFPPEFLGRIDKIIPLLRLNANDTARLTVVLAKKVAGP